MRTLPFCIPVVLSLMASMAQADAGKFQFVYGDVAITRANGTRAVPAKGDRIEEGDVITTGTQAQTQLVMNDGGLIAVRPDSRLRIDVFRFSGKTDGSEQGVFGLLKGGFRAITGLIGRVNKDNYKIQTATATIGIRGTDHESLYIAPPAPGETPIGPPGTYNKVNVGNTFLQTATGRLELGANQVGFVPGGGGAAPMLLPNIPDFLKSTPSIKPTAKAADQANTADESAAAQPTATKDTSTAEGSPASDASTADALAGDAPNMVSAGPVADAAPDTALIAPSPPGVFNPANAILAANGSALAGGGVGSTGPTNGAGTVGTAANQLSLVLDGSGDLLAIKADKFSYDRNGAPTLTSGGATVSGESIKWGVYDGGTMIDNGVTAAKTKFFWMTSTSTTTPANLLTTLSAGSLTFSTVGGYTKPITENGSVGGSVTASSITLTNLTGVPSVTAYSISVTDALGRNWNASLNSSQSLASFQTGGTNNLSAACSGACSSTGSGNAQGVAIGNPTPVGMVSSYKLQDISSNAVVGSVLTR